METLNLVELNKLHLLLSKLIHDREMFCKFSIVWVSGCNSLCFWTQSNYSRTIHKAPFWEHWTQYKYSFFSFKWHLLLCDLIRDLELFCKFRIVWVSGCNSFGFSTQFNYSRAIHNSPLSEHNTKPKTSTTVLVSSIFQFFIDRRWI